MPQARAFTAMAAFSGAMWLGSAALELMSIEHQIVPQVATWITILAATCTCATIQIWVAANRASQSTKTAAQARAERTLITSRMLQGHVYTAGHARVPAQPVPDEQRGRTTVQQRIRGSVDRLPVGAWRDAYNLGRKSVLRELRSKPEEQ